MTKIIRFAFLWITLLVLAGCTTPPPDIMALADLPPTQTAAPVATMWARVDATRHAQLTAQAALPTATTRPSIPTLTPFPTPIATPIALSEFPLGVGSTWVYSSTEYDVPLSLDPITLTWTCLITKTVANSESRPPYFAARVIQSTSAIDGDGPCRALDMPDHYGYVARGNYVYYNRNLDAFFLAPSEVEESSLLKYIFPLALVERWFPSYQLRNNVFGDDLDALTSAGPMDVSVPAGDFQGCYKIIDAYKQGYCIEYVCPGVGIVMKDCNHGGPTPDGYTAALVEYEVLVPPW